MNWAHWWNTTRLHQHLGHQTPAEIEAAYYEHQREQTPAPIQRNLTQYGSHPHPDADSPPPAELSTPSGTTSSHSLIASLPDWPTVLRHQPVVRRCTL